MATRPKPQQPLSIRRRRKRRKTNEDDDLTYTLLGPALRLGAEGQRVVAAQMERAEAILAARRLTKLLKTGMKGSEE